MQASSFELATCQATVFTPDEDLSTARAARDLLPRWSDRFDGDPVLIPSLEGLPRDVPRIILGSKSGEWRCEIASARVNLFWQRIPERSALGLAAFYTEAAQVLLEYAEVTRPRIARLAAVTNWFTRHDSPGLLLAQHFCKEEWQRGPLKRPESFELHAHKRYSPSGLMLNSWVRNRTGTLSSGGEAQPIVLVEQDLNTLAEELDSRSFDDADLRSFFGLVPEEFSQILHLYYPEEDS